MRGDFFQCKMTFPNFWNPFDLANKVQLLHLVQYSRALQQDVFRTFSVSLIGQERIRRTNK
jgi:hypothetical protein